MQKLAKEPNDLDKLYVECVNAGDVEGLVSLYEPNATLSTRDGEVVSGAEKIRQFFIRYLADNPQLAASDQAPAICNGDLALTSSRLSNGDITAEIARRQVSGNWLWSVDQFALIKGT